jgi:hypothetical protein
MDIIYVINQLARKHNMLQKSVIMFGLGSLYLHYRELQAIGKLQMKIEQLETEAGVVNEGEELE